MVNENMKPWQQKKTKLRKVTQNYAKHCKQMFKQNCFFQAWSHSDGNFLVELFCCSFISVILDKTSNNKRSGARNRQTNSKLKRYNRHQLQQPFAKWAIFIVWMVHMLLEIFFVFIFDFFVVVVVATTVNIYKFTRPQQRKSVTKRFLVRYI